MMDEKHFSYIGKQEVWGQEQFFGLSLKDRRHHSYVIGKSGSGKTTLLRNLILQDIEAGLGVAVIDPHGDLAESLLDHIPPWRTDHVVYFNPSDLEYPIGFNLLYHLPRDERHLVASGVVGAFKSIWRDSWGPRLEYLLYASVAALLECQNTSLFGLPRLLSDPDYRNWVVRQVKDPMVRSFWENEFAHYSKQFMQEVIAPLQNKVGQFFMSPVVRNVLGQVKRKIDVEFMMNDRRILIANLSKGRLGEDKASLMGALLVTSFYHAALGRAVVPESERRDFMLYVDEFQSFATDSFASILSEARKYRLCLTLSHQYIAQVPETIREAVFGNVGSLIAFRVGSTDAAVLDREFGGPYDSFSRFTDMGNHEVWAKLLQEGRQTEPFKGKTLPPLGEGYNRGYIIKQRSREKYSVRRKVIEGKIRRWMREE